MELSNTYRNLLQIPQNQVYILSPDDPIDLSAIKLGILFVLAKWSMASQKSFRTLNNVMKEFQEKLYFKLYIANTDDRQTEQFIVRNGDVPSGGGETYWIKDGNIAAKMASYDDSQAPKVRSNLSLLADSAAP